MKIAKETLLTLIEKNASRGKVDLLTFGEVIDKLPERNIEDNKYYIAVMYVENRDADKDKSYTFVDYAYWGLDYRLMGAKYYGDVINTGTVSVSRTPDAGRTRFLIIELKSQDLIGGK